MLQLARAPKKLRAIVVLLAVIALGAPSASAQDNTAFGTDALINNTTGGFNSAFGFDAMTSNLSGSFDVGAGSAALFSNTSGAYNTGLGTYAMGNTTATPPGSGTPPREWRVEY